MENVLKIVPPNTSKEISDLLDRTQAGDKKALAQLRKHWDADPEPWLALGDMASRARDAFLAKAFTDKTGILTDLVTRKMERIVSDVAGADPSPIERLLAERIALT